MADLPRSQLAGYAIAAVLVVVLGIRYLPASGGGMASGAGGSRSAPPGAHPSAAGSLSASPAPAGEAVVDVTGAVRRPGVYHLGGGDRVQDAVRRAGGPRGNADLAAVNLAAKLTDGAQILVPARGAAGAAGAGGGPASAPGATSPAPPVNLNTATAEQLDALDGIGPTTAQKIVAYRQAHGGFGSLQDLDRIPGIGPKRIAALRGKVTT